MRSNTIIASENVSDTRYNGTVKWFSQEKNYGFIEPTSSQTPGVGEKDLFVHLSGLDPSLTKLMEGQKVSFLVAKRNARFCAAEVKVE